MSWTFTKPVALIKAFARGTARRNLSTVSDASGRTALRQERALRPREHAVAAVRSAPTLRPEQEKPLLDEGMPPDGSPIYHGAKRLSDSPDEAARKFVVWVRAVGATGTHSARKIGALYWECAEADHRRPVSNARFLKALETAQGIRLAPSASDARKRVWTIEPAQSQQISQPQSSATPAPVGEPRKHKPRLGERFVPDQDYVSQQLLQANAHFARRQGGARKQRGSRETRWGAA